MNSTEEIKNNIKNIQDKFNDSDYNVDTDRFDDLYTTEYSQKSNNKYSENNDNSDNITTESYTTITEPSTIITIYPKSEIFKKKKSINNYSDKSNNSNKTGDDYSDILYSKDSVPSESVFQSDNSDKLNQSNIKSNNNSSEKSNKNSSEKSNNYISEKSNNNSSEKSNNNSSEKSDGVKFSDNYLEYSQNDQKKNKIKTYKLKNM